MTIWHFIYNLKIDQKYRKRKNNPIFYITIEHFTK